MNGQLTFTKKRGRVRVVFGLCGRYIRPMSTIPTGSMSALTALRRALRLSLPFLWKDRKSRRASATTLLLIAVGTLMQTAAPLLLQQLTGHTETLAQPLFGVLAVGLALCWAEPAMADWQRIVFFKVSNQAIRTVRMRIVVQMHRVPVQAWARYSVAEILSANARVSFTFRRFISTAIVDIFPTLFQLISFSMALLKLCSGLWYFPTVLGLAYLHTFWNMHGTLTARRAAWAVSDQVRTAMDDSLRSTKFARFHLSAEKTQLREKFDLEADRWFNSFSTEQRLTLFPTIWLVAWAAGGVWHLMSALQAGRLHVGSAIGALSFMTLLIARWRKSVGYIRDLMISAIDLEKVLFLLDLPVPAALSAPQPSSPATPNGNCPIVRLKNVSFGYPALPPLLNQLSLDVYAGDKIAIVGDSGAGKSTLCHLLTGTYFPQDGEVLLDNVPIQACSPSVVGKRIHFIDQDARLRTGSIAENVGADVLQPAQQTVLAYLQTRHCDHAGEAAQSLSGGERQRALIARCLQYRPALLVLDETLSALDQEAAQLLLDLVCKEIPSVVLVTHRKKLTRNFARVYRLKKGKLWLHDSPDPQITPDHRSTQEL